MITIIEPQSTQRSQRNAQSPLRILCVLCDLCGKKIKRPFSLLEVLIAFMIISLSLPLLMAPFLYSAVDQKETLEKLRIESAGHRAITSFLVDLHLGKVLGSQIVPTQAPIKPEWITDDQIVGSYTLKKLKSSQEKTSEDKPEATSKELWEVTFSLQAVRQKTAPATFPYHFIVMRGNP